ncbi:MAG: hypothetical protein ABSE73_00730 [Planctomycetota bacterium]
MRQNVAKYDCLPYWCCYHNIISIGHLPKEDIASLRVATSLKANPGRSQRCLGVPLQERLAPFLNELARAWRRHSPQGRLWWEPWELSAGQVLRSVERLQPEGLGLALHSNIAEVMATLPVDRWFRNTCGLACGSYMQSNGTLCDHNWVYGPKAVTFMLTCIQQRLLNPDTLTLIEKALTEIAERVLRQTDDGATLRTAQARLVDLDRKFAKASENMALAETPLRRSETAQVVEKLAAEKTILEKQVGEVTRQAICRGNAKDEVAAAMSAAHRLLDLAQRPDDPVGLTELFSGTNARLFLRFGPAAWGKRKTNKIAGG